MFINTQQKEDIERYKSLLTIISNLSRLSSDAPEPYLYYRMAEKIFCRAFNAKDFTRSDISIDVCKNNIGIGLKTFLFKGGNRMEKVAEFNKDSSVFRSMSEKEIIYHVASLRNMRIDNTSNVVGIDSENMIYHNVVRDIGKLLIYENKLSKIKIDKIKIINKGVSSIYFTDDVNDYSFNLSKSTLLMRFITRPVMEFDITILDDPFTFLEGLVNQNKELFEADKKLKDDFIVLPLYSVKSGEVEVRSGLNQWNANGRDRNFDEIYIPIPADIRKKYPNFFPSRDIPFNLVLPSVDNEVISAKVCQQGDKALMSNPNSALGKWLLRDILKLDKGQLLTKELLNNLGIDSVKITKQSNSNYLIDFKKLGSYDDFIDNILEDD